MRTVSNLGRQFNTSIDWPRRHDQNVIFASLNSFLIHGIQQGVFMNGWERSNGLSLELDPQQVKHIATRKDLVQTVGNFDS
jgi:hypothetical protein